MLQVEDDCVIARDTTLMSRPVVWYVPGPEAASRLQELPDDLERCPVSELTLPTGPPLPGVLLVDLPGDEASARALAVAQRDGLPVVALVDDGGADAICDQPCYAYLNPSVPGVTLATVLRQACVPAHVMLDALEMRMQLEELNAIGIGLSAERDLGALQLINCKRIPTQAEVLPFPERYRNLAASLASQAGVAIQNARLFQELGAALQEVEASQKQLVQAERLSALGEMAAGVAHDFNNLLAVVVGRAEILIAKGQDPSVARDIEIIRTAAWDGANTVRRIQEFTRTRRVRTASQVEIPALLRDVVELTKGRWKDEAQSRGISYDVVVEGGTDSPVAGISAELREVFMNLLINGLDAMPRGGQFVFRISDDASTVIVAAEDTGSGMSEETRRRVLEPFFTTKGARGTGLGLAVSWGIVKRHGGTIEIESTVGMGSIFTIRLPISSGDSAPDVAETTVRQIRSGRILVIDDEPEVRCVLRDMLTPCGHTVIEADSGETGLALLEREAVDVILTDISMPGMSGWDVAAACQRQFPQTPLGFVTGWGDRLDEQETTRAGVRFIVSKPFAPADVQGHVAEALASTG